MKAFSFVHAADLHLGYSQYGLEIRRGDFNKAFEEVVDRTVELKPDFMIIAGDMFHHARPSNVTLERTIRELSRLRKAGIPVLTVDGSHDSAPNTVTGTILDPLDSAGLIFHLPRHDGACWRKEGCCYVYGVPNFRTKRRTEELLPVFMEKNEPKPHRGLFNIFVFHMALDIPSLTPPYMEAEASLQLIPSGFDYYAAGHVHKSYSEKFKTGLLIYSGTTETINYDEAAKDKGFYHVDVDGNGTASPQFMKLESPRRFIVLEQDFTGVAPSKITELVLQLVKGADEEDAVIVPVMKGVLPAEASRADLDVALLRNAGEKALSVHPVVLLRESELSEEVVRSIFEAEFKDLKTKAFEYFLKVFSERYTRHEAERIAHVAVRLIEPLSTKGEKEVKGMLEELLECELKSLN